MRLFQTGILWAAAFGLASATSTSSLGHYNNAFQKRSTQEDRELTEMNYKDYAAANEVFSHKYQMNMIPGETYVFMAILDTPFSEWFKDWQPIYQKWLPADIKSHPRLIIGHVVANGPFPHYAFVAKIHELRGRAENGVWTTGYNYREDWQSEKFAKPGKNFYPERSLTALGITRLGIDEIKKIGEASIMKGQPYHADNNNCRQFMDRFEPQLKLIRPDDRLPRPPYREDSPSSSDESSSSKRKRGSGQCPVAK